MKLNYKKLGQYIREVSIKNKSLEVNKLLGVSITKEFITSIANTIGADMSKYKVVRTGQFAYGPVTSRNGEKISVALLQQTDCIISTSYTVFEIIDPEELCSEYLMMWFRRPEFDRYARYMSHGSVREIFGWEEMCEVELPVPNIKKQREIVKEYNTIVDRIKLNEELNKKLEETAHALFRKYFINIEGCENEEIDHYIQFNPKHSIKKDKIVSYIEMANLQENSHCIKDVVRRKFTAGAKFKNNDTLLARITPCLENGKTAFVNCLDDKEIAYGSTEFIVMRAKASISPYWIYCLAKNEKFRSYAISSMVGSSGRQRVHSDYLKLYTVPKITNEQMNDFHSKVSVLFKNEKQISEETRQLLSLLDVLLSKLTKIGA